MSISSLGIGSGLDLGSLVSQLVAAERAPVEGRLNRSESQARTELSALGSLKSAMGKLTTAVKALDGVEVGLKATSSDTALLGAKVTDEAERGTYSINVTTLASAQSLASSAFADPDAALGEGTFTLTVGEETLNVDLTADNNSLRAVRDAINDSDLDVQAVIVRDGDQHRLLLTSGETGTAGQITTSVSGGVDTRLISSEMQETAPARDATFSVNGLALTASSNEIDDVIPGLTLSLKAPTEEGVPLTVRVAPDNDDFKKKLEAVVTAYNGLVTSMTASGQYNAETGRGGALVGDATLRSIQSQVRGAFSRGLATDFQDNPFNSLVQLGLTTDLGGRATLDADELAKALETSEGGVEALVGAFGKAFSGTLESYTGDGGILESRTDGLDAKLKRIGDQRVALDLRMEDVQERLRTQFTALDTMLSQFQSTSAYLAQQLASLPGAAK